MLIFIVSDSTGETGDQVILAAASQFPIENLVTRRFPFVQTNDDVDWVFDDYLRNNDDPANGLIAFTLVSPDLRKYVVQKGETLSIPTMDILGPIMDKIANVKNMDPQLKPGRIREVNQGYFDRIEAIEFAIKYDDGKDHSGFNEADVVLIGISRTSKTPLCIYLAHKSIKAANIPLVPETPVPKQLYQLQKFKVIGLTIQPDVLHTIRVNRLLAMGVKDNSTYSSMERILAELEFGEKVMKRIGCPVIDTSNRAMEETAGKIIQIMQRSIIKQ
jgi:regulator of PEP synthase PpsR (kinase-PPPase family)